MADYPANVSFGTVTGDLSWFSSDSEDADLHPERRPVLGVVNFTPTVSGMVVNKSQKQVYLPDTEPVGTDEFGRFEVELVATDDPDLQPSGWTYRMEILPNTVRGQAQRKYVYHIWVKAGETLDLSEIVSGERATSGATLVYDDISATWRSARSVEGSASGVLYSAPYGADEILFGGSAVGTLADGSILVNGASEDANGVVTINA